MTLAGAAEHPVSNLPSGVALDAVATRHRLAFGQEPSADARAEGYRAGFARTVRLRDADAALIVWPSTQLASGAIAACRRAEVPYVLDVRNSLRADAAPNWLQRRRTRRVLAGAFRVLAASPAIRGEVIG
ncbi:MAG: hypothetical protein SFV21_07340, partial [Rhodospirillaceae bacterium]|nr:hypothetical protein [Rhodospirillaceae bacterium]